MDRRRFLQASVLATLGACAGDGVPPTDGALASPGTSPSPTSSAVAPTVAPAPTASESPTADPSPPVSEQPEPPPSDAPPAQASAVAVLCRDAWGAAAPGDGFVEHTIAQMTIHHSAVVLGDNAKAPSRLRQHQRYHQSQGWPDIAYHLGVDRRGNCYDLRPTAYRGDTFTSYDPTGHFLVLAEGNFDQEQPTDEQLESIARAFAWAFGAFGVPAGALTGHRDHAQTSCPGDALYVRVDDLRARAQELAAAGVERVDRCGPEASAYVQDVEAGRA